MAKVTPGPLAGVISGKIGNTVFSRGRYGPYIRTRMIPTAVQTDATISTKARLTSLSKGWGALAAGDRQAWNTYAQMHPIIDRLGNSQVLSGSAMYMSINNRIIKAGGTKISVPVMTVAPDPLTTVSITAVATAQTVTIAFAATPQPAGCCLAVWLAVVDSAGRSYTKNLLKLVAVSAAAQVTPYVITTEAIARFGKLIIGQVYHAEVAIWDKTSGLRSGILPCNFTVIAA